MKSGNKGFGQRSYRLLQQAHDLKYFNVKVQETDLAIGIETGAYSDRLASLCYNEILKLRRQLEEYILRHPQFKSSLVPVEMKAGRPPIAVEMAQSAALAGVGPMAAVAGALACFLGQILCRYSAEVIIENGGDIFMDTRHDRVIAVYAGNSPFTFKTGIKVRAGDTPLGICTSSGTVGHSLSFGNADAVVIKGKSASLADAAATGAGNLIKNKYELEKAIEYIKNLDQDLGIVAIKEDRMAAWGNIELIPLG